MKKVIIFVTLIFSIGLKAQNITPTYTPYAAHDFGTDSLTNLDKQIKVLDFDCNAVSRKITVTYEVVLLTPSGVPLQCFTGTYLIDDSTSALNYTNYWNSAIGIAIRADFASDMLKIKSFSTLQNDLQQQ